MVVPPAKFSDKRNVGEATPTVGCELLMTPSVSAVPVVLKEMMPVGAGSPPPPPEKVDFRLAAFFPNAIPLLTMPLRSPFLRLRTVLPRLVPVLTTSLILPNKPFDLLAAAFVRSMSLEN